MIWLHGQAVKTSPFHGGNTGSIPVGVILKSNDIVCHCFFYAHGTQVNIELNDILCYTTSERNIKKEHIT